MRRQFSPMENPMRRLVFSATALLAAMIALPSLAVDRNVSFINETGRDIAFVGFNPPGDEEWNDNEIGDVLESGDDEYVKFNQADHGCNWNIRIVYADDESAVRLDGIDLCAINDITLYYDGDSGDTTYETE
jgi:hypothetical protein